MQIAARIGRGGDQLLPDAAKRILRFFHARPPFFKNPDPLATTPKTGNLIYFGIRK
jgi:hypothetical protein